MNYLISQVFHYYNLKLPYVPYVQMYSPIEYWLYKEIDNICIDIHMCIGNNWRKKCMTERRKQWIV